MHVKNKQEWIIMEEQNKMCNLKKLCHLFLIERVIGYAVIAII